MKEKNITSLTIEEYENILNNIPGLIIIDNKNKIKFLSDDMKKRLIQMGTLKEDEPYIGEPLDKIHPLSKLKQTKKEEYTSYTIRGIPNISKIKPIYKNNKISGVLDYDIIFGTDELNNLLNKLNQFISDEKIDLSSYISKISKEQKQKYTIQNIIGNSSKIQNMKDLIYKYSATDGTVLITGETGTGKELIAHSIHNLSKRGNKDIICVNCASIPETLLESELFGFDEGAFTGSKKGGNIGKFEQAHKSTIFLDEIDQLQYHLQPKLLRVLQEKEISKIGGTTKSIDVRIIAATNKNLLELVKQNKFREDLYYRLNILNIKTIPLREIKEDIPLLTETCLNKLSPFQKITVDSKIYTALNSYNWPGNIRELYNIIERAYVNRKNPDKLTYSDLDQELLIKLNQKPIIPDTATYNLAKLKEETEKKAIQETLNLCDNNKSEAAKLLGITRANLYKKMEKYNIK